MIILKVLDIPKFKKVGLLYFPITNSDGVGVLEFNTRTESMNEIDTIEFLGSICGISADEYETGTKDDDDVDNGISWLKRLEIIHTFKALGF